MPSRFAREMWKPTEKEDQRIREAAEKSAKERLELKRGDTSTPDVPDAIDDGATPNVADYSDEKDKEKSG